MYVGCMTLCSMSVCVQYSPETQPPAKASTHADAAGTTLEQIWML
jgi:hypothetical protein